MERKRRFQTRAQYAEEKAKESKFDKVNKNLNYLIVLVAVLIIGTLVFILSKDPQPKNEALDDTETADVATNKKPSTDEKSKTVDDEKSDEEQSEDETSEEQTEAEENTVLPSADPVVKEVHMNKAWQAYPTEQTGEHVSTFQKGHIDYEEKLKAIFSVLDLQQDNSIVLSVKNNGNAKTAIAVVTSMDKEQKYRVSIEWFDGEGWKPMRLEVLNTVEGAY